MTAESPHRSHGRPPDERTPVLRAEVLEHDDRLDECTLFPHDVDEEERRTKWIAALEGSYVDVEAFR